MAEQAWLVVNMLKKYFPEAKQTIGSAPDMAIPK
jgi:hypothetical protein